MATVVDPGASAGVWDSTANDPTYASSAFTPAVGDVPVVQASITGTAIVGTVTDSQGGSYHPIANCTRSGGGSVCAKWIRNTAIASAVSTTVTIDVTADAGTGCSGKVLLLRGMSAAGSSAVRQTKTISNQAGGGTPAVTFDTAALTDNPTIGIVTAQANPPAITEPSGWTENHDDGHPTPDGGTEIVSRDSGFTGTTITWGSTSAAAFGAIITEFDASAGAAGHPAFRRFGAMMYAARRIFGVEGFGLN